MIVERNVGSGVAATLLSSFFEFTEPLRWLFLLGIVLIIVDFRFGLRASVKRGDNIRFSRAIRRTINKAVDYVCWVFLAGSIGAAFGDHMGIKILPILVMLVVYGIEINSCFNNYFEAKGTPIKVDFYKFFSKKLDTIDITEPNKKSKDETDV